MLPVDAVKQLNAEPAKRQFASGQWIDIIPLIDPKLDKWDIKDFTGANKWSRVESDLVSGYDDQPSKLILPLDADWKSYECEIEFTRRRGYAPGFSLNLPNTKTAIPLTFDVQGGGGMLLFRSGEKFVKQGYPIVTGKRTKVRVEVTRSTENDTVKAFFNGEFAGTWTGDLDSIPANPKDKFPENRRLSLWNSGSSEFVFHRIRVKLLDGGTATSLRPVPAEQSFQQPADDQPVTAPVPDTDE